MILAWHFTGSRLRDGSPLPKVGEWEHFPGKLELCESGLHWSLEPFDALQYAPGINLRYVEVKGPILTQSDKGCAHWRRTIAQMDATEMLRYFARMQALSVVHLWDAPDVVLDYLMTGDEGLRVAAQASAQAALAWSAAWAAAPATWSAVSVARAARAAAEEESSKEFNSLVFECFEGVMK